MSLLLFILVLLLAICWGAVDAASSTSKSAPMSSATRVADLDLATRDSRR